MGLRGIVFTAENAWHNIGAMAAAARVCNGEERML